MSLLKAIKAQLGLSNTPANNFTITAEAANGTLKLARGNAGATTQDILTVDAAGNINAPVSIKKAGSVLQALSDFSGSNVSLTASGYQKLPSGLIIQWGRISSTGSFTFPIAFTTLYSFTISTMTGNYTIMSSVGNTGFTTSDTSYGGASKDACWIAIGI